MHKVQYMINELKSMLNLCMEKSLPSLSARAFPCSLPGDISWPAPSGTDMHTQFGMALYLPFFLKGPPTATSDNGGIGSGSAPSPNHCLRNFVPVRQ